MLHIFRNLWKISLLRLGNQTMSCGGFVIGINMKKWKQDGAISRHSLERWCRAYVSTLIHPVGKCTDDLKPVKMCFIYTYLLTSSLRVKLNYWKSIIWWNSIAPLRSYLNSESTILHFIRELFQKIARGAKERFLIITLKSLVKPIGVLWIQKAAEYSVLHTVCKLK